jgi:A/G-specific adenine glycosylase
VNKLLDWYAVHGRANLPWRTTRDPYYTLVSEFMLQQTQVDRVVPKFEAFIAGYPDVRALAQAPVADVIRAWQGLGYNSRAIRLSEIAKVIVERLGGSIPSDIEMLKELPGVGPYTAAAISAFAFDGDVAAMDTNLRRVVHRLAFGMEFPPAADSARLDEEARRLLPKGAAHDWNSAMMDLGATICTARAPKCLVCPLRDECAAAPIDSNRLESARALHAKKPSQKAVPFERTTRFARGRIIDALRELPPGKRISLLDLHGQLQSRLPERSLQDLEGIVAILERDGLVTRADSGLTLRE